MKPIQKIISKENERVNNILNRFEVQVEKNLPESRELFNRFKWNLEKNFFTEEKIIFSIYTNSQTEEESCAIFNILREHQDILWLIKEIEDSLAKNKIPNTTDLKMVLENHINFKNKVFYPRLDEELTGKQRELMIDRAEEIIIS
jgi:iron-sulfur cluster repair protein YtfE (RIC family)